MEPIKRPLNYFNVTFNILRNGQLYGRGNMKTQSIDPREQGLNTVKTKVLKHCHDMDNTFRYEVIMMKGKKITLEEYNVLKEEMTFD
jgi:hypothetical protein